MILEKRKDKAENGISLTLAKIETAIPNGKHELSSRKKNKVVA